MRASVTKIMPVLLMLVLIVLACGNNQPPVDQIIARVGNSYLTRDLVEQLIPESVAEADRNYYIRQLAERWVNNEVLAQAAREEGLSLSALEQWRVRKLQAELLSTRYLNNRIPYDIHASTDEIQKYYDQHMDQFRRREDEVHLVHLFFKELDKTLVAEIKKSTDLANVIEKNYLGFQVSPILERNGDLGYLQLSHLQENFRKAIRGEKKGLIYGPIKSNEGFHYLQVLDRKPAGSVRSLELVRSEIATRIAYLKRIEMTKTLTRDIRKKIEVETFYSNIL